ncbi:hypothetical protein BaRGS_00000610 [Batillaria attramentaria]|uniref:Proteasome assembly chaperone 3 n=1 Tax=Batillaria attramentaria TaxID=370345 RepID=A0ABD0MAI5_9CAEN
MAATSEAKFPVSSAQAGVLVNGKQTDIHCSIFTDHLYVIVTQYCKLGTLVQVKSETVVDELEGPSPVLTTKVLFGKDEPLTHVMARHIVSSLKPHTPVLLGLSLRDTTREVLHALLPAIQSCVARAQSGPASSQSSTDDGVR